MRDPGFYYRGALACGTIPLAGGLGIFLLWTVTRRDWLEEAGFFWLLAGVALFFLGVVSLVMTLAAARRKPPPVATWKLAAALLLLLVNFPTAGTVIRAVESIKHPLQRARVMDVTRPELVQLRPGGEALCEIYIRVRGHLDGRAFLNATRGDVSIGPGPVDQDLSRGDFYDDVCPLQYTPQDVRGGHLEIEYRFE